MQSENLVAVATTFEPVDVPLFSTKPILPPHSLNKQEERKQDKEEQKQEYLKQKQQEEEERAEIEAAQYRWNSLVISRMKFMRKLGRPCKVIRRNWSMDARCLFNRESNCDKIDWGDGPVDKEILLEKEKSFWNAAMEYLKAQNMVSEYDLIPSNMTLFPIMSNKGFFYHGNLVGCKREFPSKGAQQYFFLEVNRTREKTYNVTACITLDDDDVENDCEACPSHTGVLHPRKGGFTFGRKEGTSLGATTVPTATVNQEDGANVENAQPTVEVPSKTIYRHDYYNSPTEVVVTIFANGVPADSVVVDLSEQMLSVSIEVPGEEPYHFQSCLFSKIIPEKCKYTVLSTKVEIRLAKAEQVTWTSLDHTGLSKEDCGATPARALDRVVPSSALPAPLPTLGNETLGPLTTRLSALVGGGTLQPGQLQLQ